MDRPPAHFQQQIGPNWTENLLGPILAGPFGAGFRAGISAPAWA
jgi:hypothetical protein